MLTWLQRSLFALILTMVVVLAGVIQPAQAAYWWSTNGWVWTVEAICPDGVRLLSRFSDSPTPEAAEQWVPAPVINYVAYATRSAPEEPTKILTPPLGTDEIALGAQLGDVDLILTVQQKPLVWTDDEAGTKGKAYLYGRATLTWNALNVETLPLGTPVAVYRGGSSYFIGQIRACTRAQSASPLYLPAIGHSG